MQPAMTSVFGLLFSQIGYDSNGAKRALVRGPRGFLRDDAGFKVLYDGREAFSGKWELWGEKWGSHWWIADFSALDAAGAYVLKIEDGDQTLEGAFKVAAGLLESHTMQHVSLEQAERRQKLALKVEGRALGWQDAGCHWQEANSHAVFTLGLCDYLERRRHFLAQEDVARFEAQICNGADYFSQLQDMAAQKGLGEGALVHQSFKYDDFVLPSDVAKAAATWARAAAFVPHQAQEYSSRAKRALRWLETEANWSKLAFNAAPHGTPPGFVLPNVPPTPDLTMMLWARIELEAKNAVPSDEVLRLAERVMARQFGESEGAVFGHFRLWDEGNADEKIWFHGVGEEGFGFNNGQTMGQNLFPFFRLLELWPEHDAAPRWKKTLEHYARGYFWPGSRANPFGIAPNAHVKGEGFLFFASLWHGANAIYGQAAALALEFAQLLDEPECFALATANLQWIAGLNCGLTLDSQTGCEMTSYDVPENAVWPVSMICGIGARTAGSWLQIRGSICNGFSTGAQFRWDAPLRAASEENITFTDEDWITHAGTFLMALARLPR